LPRLPLSTLFPYTTLFRSRVSQLQPLFELRLLAGGDAQPEGSLRESDGTSARLPAGAPRLDSRRRVRPGRHVALPVAFFRSAERSEEHTSELQSRFDLVCR